MAGRRELNSAGFVDFGCGAACGSAHSVGEAGGPPRFPRMDGPEKHRSAARFLRHG